MTQVNILMQSEQDDNRTMVLTLNDTDVVPAELQLAVAKKAGWMPVLDKAGKIKRVVAAYESDGRPAGFRRVSAFLRS